MEYKVVGYGIINFKPYRLFILIAFVIWFSSCQNDNEKSYETSKVNKVNKIVVPEFKSDSAYSFILYQVNFGPRVPNSSAHDSCAEYLVNKLKRYTENVYVQHGEVKAFDGVTLKIQNIIASFNHSAKRRILLAAHWDTRPWADQDTKNIDKPIDGANDGASGVGILLEIARNLSLNNPSIGVDIIFFDAEDYGQPEHSKLPPKQNTYCLGSQYWTKNFPKYMKKPEYAILLDMVGARHAQFMMEETSMYYAESVMKKVWDTANRLGYSSYFSYQKTQPIVDDHHYMNTIAKIPTIDIIQYDASTKSHFGEFWHTHEDNINIIDKNTLKAVGQTLLEVIYKES